MFDTPGLVSYKAAEFMSYVVRYRTQIW